jgi:selenoprotein W-related protein
MYEEKIESLKLIPTSGGKYEVSVNGKLVYSKMATGCHANPGEVEKLVGEVIQGR